MSSNYKFHNPTGIFFVSFAVVYWLDVFTRRQYKDMLIDSLNYCQKEKGMEIYGYCIMTNHVHLIFKSTSDRKPQDVLGDFKRYTSKALVKAIRENPKESRREIFMTYFAKAARQSSNVHNYQFWRHDNKPIEIWSPKVFDQKLHYIHMNPVVSGFVDKPIDYIYSSARQYAGEQGELEVVCGW